MIWCKFGDRKVPIVAFIVSFVVVVVIVDTDAVAVAVVVVGVESHWREQGQMWGIGCEDITPPFESEIVNNCL